jgi:hypothetical protein
MEVSMFSGFILKASRMFGPDLEGEALEWEIVDEV